MSWQWHDDQDPRVFSISEWIAQLKAKAAAESKAMNERCVENFNETVDRIDREADAAEVRRVIYDIWGPRTWEINEPATLSEGLR